MRALRRSLTTRGAAFAGCGLVLVASGILLGQHDVTRIGVLLLVLTVIAFVLVRRHGLRLDVVRTAAPARVAIDERSVVTVRIRNTESSISPVVMAEESIDYALGDRPRFVVPSLRPGEAHEVQYTVRSHTRGVHRIGPLGVRVRDPFGLSLRAAAVSGRAELVVLPRVVPLPGGRSLGSGIGSEGSVPHMVALHGEDDQTVREYRDGDDLRRIHWPATARTGDLMVRQEDRPAKRRAVVLLDCRASGHGGSGRGDSLEWSVTTAASVTAHLVDGGYAVHLLTPDPGADTGCTTTRPSTTASRRSPACPPAATTVCGRCSMRRAPSPRRVGSSSTSGGRWPTTTPVPWPPCASPASREPPWSWNRMPSPAGARGGEADMWTRLRPPRWRPCSPPAG